MKKSSSLIPARQKWEDYWHGHPMNYELPPTASADREFLTKSRSIKKDQARIRRVSTELRNASEKLFHTGPAVTVFGSARFKTSHPYYKLARKVGKELAKAGFAVMTGGGPGIMEAANRGAHETGGASLGLNIILPHEQAANPYVDQSIEFEYFFTRKTCLLKYSCAYIIMPGGLGTMDELFEAVTLVQCGKIGPFPIILMGSEFWQGLRDWGMQLKQLGVFTEEEVGFGYFTDSPREAVDFILASLPQHLRPIPPTEKPSSSL